MVKAGGSAEHAAATTTSAKPVTSGWRKGASGFGVSVQFEEESSGPHRAQTKLRIG
jgi:hypothetical protein